MPVINGTSGADTIDVSDDAGTLNGTSQDGPITGIEGVDGYDTITVSNSTITNTVDGGTGGMDLTVTDSIIGTITSSGASNATLSNSTVDTLETVNGGATVTATNTNIGTIISSTGADLILNMTGGNITGGYFGGTGSDVITLTDTTIANAITFEPNGGNDNLTLNNATVGDDFFLQFGPGDNTVNIEGNTSFGDNANFDALDAGFNQLNLPDGTLLFVHNEGAYTVGTDPLPSGTNLDGSFVLQDGSSVTFTDFDSFGVTGGPVCYTEGTLILTPSGEVPIETLAVGDLVITATGKAEPILWIAAREMAFHDHQAMHCPVLIKTGALGAGRPTRDLAVSPQHCLLMDMPSREPDFGTEKAFVRAKFLTGLPRVRVMKGKTHTRYITFLLSKHQIIQANGAWSESFYPGPMGLKMLSAAKRKEVKKIISELRAFPDCGYGPRVTKVLNRIETKRLLDILQKGKRGKSLNGCDSFAFTPPMTKSQDKQAA